jgi:transcriptional regulator with XRE-family HTH domain
MSDNSWFTDLLDRYEDDPDFLTEQVLLDVTEQICVRLNELGLKPADLARRLGVSRAAVSQMLNGKPNMTLRTLVGVAHALDVELRPRASGERHDADLAQRPHSRDHAPEGEPRRPDPVPSTGGRRRGSA